MCGFPSPAVRDAEHRESPLASRSVLTGPRQFSCDERVGVASSPMRPTQLSPALSASCEKQAMSPERATFQSLF